MEDRWFNNNFIRVPTSVIKKLQEYSSYLDIFEVTPPTIGCTVYHRDGLFDKGTVLDYDSSEMTYTVMAEDGTEYYGICCYDISHFVPANIKSGSVNLDYGVLPGSSVMYACTGASSIQDVEEHMFELAAAGFKIFSSTDFGYVVGTDYTISGGDIKAIYNACNA